MKRGFYIIFEGCEGAGKSTQTKLLSEYLENKGIKNIITKEPGGTKEGQQIHAILTNKENTINSLSELFLFLADRVESYEKIIKPELAKGTTIIKDRSRFSTEAYQGAAGKINMELIKQLNKIATDEVNPDLLIIIDINPEEGLQKEVDSNRFSAKGLEYHKKVREEYLKIAKENSDFCIVVKYQEGNPEAMQQEIRKHIKEKLQI